MRIASFAVLSLLIASLQIRSGGKCACLLVVLAEVIRGMLPVEAEIYERPLLEEQYSVEQPGKDARMLQQSDAWANAEGETGTIPVRSTSTLLFIWYHIAMGILILTPRTATSPDLKVCGGGQ